MAKEIQEVLVYPVGITEDMRQEFLHEQELDVQVHPSVFVFDDTAVAIAVMDLMRGGAEHYRSLQRTANFWTSMVPVRQDQPDKSVADTYVVGLLGQPLFRGTAFPSLFEVVRVASIDQANRSLQALGNPLRLQADRERVSTA